MGEFLLVDSTFLNAYNLQTIQERDCSRDDATSIPSTCTHVPQLAARSRQNVTGAEIALPLPSRQSACTNKKRPANGTIRPQRRLFFFLAGGPLGPPPCGATPGGAPQFRGGGGFAGKGGGGSLGRGGCQPRCCVSLYGRSRTR